jgi:hypothetical protein
VAPDVLAVELLSECPEAFGLWAPEDGSEAMLGVLTACWEAHREREAAARRARHAAPEVLAPGKRRLSDHLDGLVRRWGAALDTSSVGAAGLELVAAYEAGSRLELEVGGRVRLVTVGCTSGVRPELVYLVSIPCLEVGEVEVAA